MRHAWLRLSACLWPDLFWSFIFSPTPRVFPPQHLLPSSLFCFVLFFLFSSSPCSLCACSRHRWQWEQHIHCQEGLPRVCLRLRARTYVALFVSVESNSRLKGESISIFAMHFYAIAACPAVFEKQRKTDWEGGCEWREGCLQSEDCSFRFEVQNVFTRTIRESV